MDTPIQKTRILSCKHLLLLEEATVIYRECSLTGLGVNLSTCINCTVREGETPPVERKPPIAIQPVCGGEVERRKTICAACPYHVKQTGLCKRCGCIDKYKIQNTKNKCPKWEETV